MTAKKEDIRKLNPDIKSVTIGVRHLYDLTIYPLSFSQQMELSDIVTVAITDFYKKATELTDIAVVSFVVETVKANIETILAYITEPDEIKDIVKDAKEKKLVDVLTNKQLIAITEIIYHDNFEELRKKVMDLFEKMPEMPTDVLSERSLPSSSDTIPNSDSKVSDEVTETEVLQ